MKAYIYASAAMLLAALAQFISLAWFNSLVLSFFLYTLLCGIALPLGYMRFVRGIRWQSVFSAYGLIPENRKQLRFGLFLGMGMAAVMYLAFLLFGSYFMQDGAALPAVAQWGIYPDATAFLYLASLLLNGATEELFWRGMVYDILREQKRRHAAVLYPALVFGIHHIFVISRLVPNIWTTLLFMVGIIGSGVLWGYLREKTGSLFICAVCHVLVAFGYLSILTWYLFG